MDDEWLEAALAEEASDGATWSVLDGETPVAVVETALHLENSSLAAITGLAVKPDLRGQGVGAFVLREILTMHQQEGRLEHLAFIREDNRTAQRCFRRVGFKSVTPTANGEGYLEFRHTPGQALTLAQV